MEIQTLLEKTRVMHQLLQKAAGNVLDFENVANELRSIIGCNVYIVGKKGDLLSYTEIDVDGLFNLEELDDKQFSEACQQWILAILKLR